MNPPLDWVAFALRVPAGLNRAIKKMVLYIQVDLTDYSEDGVDLTLIRWFLSLTPAERLEWMEHQIADIAAIRERNAGR